MARFSDLGCTGLACLGLAIGIAVVHHVVGHGERREDIQANVDLAGVALSPDTPQLLPLPKELCDTLFPFIVNAWFVFSPELVRSPSTG